MPQAIALSPGSLLGQDLIATNKTPLMGYVNIYKGGLAPVLRQASLSTLGTTCLVELDPNDTSGNALVVACYSGETFVDGTTTRVLTVPGSFLILSPVAGSDGVAKWKVVGGDGPSIGGLTIASFDAGGASTVYDASLAFDGGSASTVYGGSLTIDGGTS